MEDGRYFLPGAATGARETIVTSPVSVLWHYIVAQAFVGLLLVHGAPRLLS